MNCEAPLDQAESVSATFSSKMKGSIDKEYSAYKITTGSGTQDLALVFGEGVGNEKYVDFKVTWTKECKVSIVKKDQDTGNALVLPFVTFTSFTPLGNFYVIVCSLSALNVITLVRWLFPST